MNPEQTEEVIHDFRQWLTEWNEVEPINSTMHSVDFSSIVAAFTALRQDVNLLTKASRTTLEQLGEQSKLATQPLPKSDSTQDLTEVQRTFLTSIIEIYDQLLLAHQQVEKRQLEIVSQQPDLQPIKRSRWLRWFGKSLPANQKPEVSSNASNQIIEALLTGYRMSMARIDRVLVQYGMEPISVQQLPFDPETMEVIEVESRQDLASGLVALEIRRGYRWRGKVFRFAQVNVVR